MVLYNEFRLSYSGADFANQHTDVRLFYLYNQDKEFYNLTSTSALLTDPKGLGYKRENGYRRVGNRFLLVTKSPVQVPFEGTVILTPPNAYVKYRDFVNFCMKEPLEIIYRPFDHIDYYNEKGGFADPTLINYTGDSDYINVKEFRFEKFVYVEEIEKEELTKYGALEVKIKLMPVTPWFRELAFGVNPVFDPTSDNPNTIQFDCDAQIDSPCQISIRGPAVNPTWTHYVGENDTIAETGKVFTILNENEWLLVDNRYSAHVANAFRYIRVSDANGTWIRNVQPSSDFSKKRWVDIKPGLNRISVGADQGSPTIQWVTVRRYYESV